MSAIIENIAKMNINIFDCNNPWDEYKKSYPDTPHTPQDLCAVFDEWGGSWIGMENLVRHDVRTCGRVFARKQVQVWADMCTMSGYQYKWALHDLLAYAPANRAKDPEVKETFGRWLQSKLDAQGLSQTAFAHHLNMSRGRVNIWVNDNGLPDVERWNVIAQWVAHWESKKLGEVLVEMGGTL